MATKKLFISSSRRGVGRRRCMYMYECTIAKGSSIFFTRRRARSFFKHARNLADEAEANGVTAEKRKLWAYFLLQKRWGGEERENICFLRIQNYWVADGGARARKEGEITRLNSYISRKASLLLSLWDGNAAWKIYLPLTSGNSLSAFLKN